jgi:20S proteasome alpha/beta subunit
VDKMDAMKKFISVLNNNPDAAYDFICNNYYNMSKEDLKNVAKELLFVIHAKMEKEEHNKALGYVAEELECIYAD